MDSAVNSAPIVIAVWLNGFISSSLLQQRPLYKPPTFVEIRSFEVASFPGLPRFLFFSFRSEYTERKPKNKKRGRPGNEAGFEVYVFKIVLSGSHPDAPVTISNSSHLYCPFVGTANMLQSLQLTIAWQQPLQIGVVRVTPSKCICASAFPQHL